MAGASLADVIPKFHLMQMPSSSLETFSFFLQTVLSACVLWLASVSVAGVRVRYEEMAQPRKRCIPRPCQWQMDVHNDESGEAPASQYRVEVNQGKHQHQSVFSTHICTWAPIHV